MKTADDFKDNVIDNSEDIIDNIIKEYIYPFFEAKKTHAELYENILIQEGIDKKQMVDRLKKLKFKVSSGKVNVDNVLIIKLK